MKWINLFGLIFNIAGAALMFFNTPYATVEPRGTSGPDSMSQAANWLFTGKHKERKQLRLIKIGFGLLLLGSFLQFIAALPG